MWGMAWLIAGLFGLILLGGLVVLARRRGGHRRGADDTLVTELLGPREVAAAPAPPAGEEAERSPAPQATKAAESSPSPSSQDAEGDWLESQLAWITEWSQHMHQQIESAGRPGTDRTE